MSSEFKEQKKQLLASYAQQQIMDAVVEIIDREGVKKLTMSKVAEQAGIAKGTLYRYFDNKDDLIDSTIQNSLEPLIMAQQEIIESDRSPDQKLKDIISFQLAFFEEHKHYFRVLTYEHQRSQDPKKRFIDNKYQQFLQRIAEVIQEGIEEELFKALNPQLLAVAFMETLIGVTMQLILKEEECDLKEARQTIIDILFTGINKD